MSHIAKVDLVIHNLDDVETELLDTFGGKAQLVRDVTEHQYYAGSKSKCDHKITVEGTKYEIGLVALPEGGFQVQYDSWDGSADRLFGRNLSKLKDAYGARVTERDLRRRGYQTRRLVTAENKLQVRAFAR